MATQPAQGLFLENREYAGVGTARPNIPPGEIWVFAQWNGENIVVSRDDEDYIPPPPPPFFRRRATQVYRFRRQTDYDIQERYLQLTQYPTTILWHVTIKLTDPLAFMDSQYQIDNFPKIQADLIAILAPIVESILQKQLKTVMVADPHTITIPPLETVLRERNFDEKVRGQFKSMGLTLQVVAKDIQCPAYQKLVEQVAIDTQKARHRGHTAIIQQEVNIELQRKQFNLDEQKKMISAVNDLQIAMQRLNYEEQYIQSIVGQVREVNPQFIALMQNAITQIGNTPNPQAVTNLVTQFLVAMRESTLGTHSGATAAPPPASNAQPRRQSSGTMALQNNTRDQHIQNLYQTAANTGWILSPPLSENVTDIIRVELSNNREVEMRIPSSYPMAKALVSRVKSQGGRISQSQVNQVTQPLLNSSYDLVKLVKQLDDTIQ